MGKPEKLPDISTSTSLIGKIQDKLIKVVVGKKPVMLNMSIETEYSIGFNNMEILLRNNEIVTTERATESDISYRYSRLYAEDKNKALLEVRDKVNEIIDSSLCLNTTT